MKKMTTAFLVLSFSLTALASDGFYLTRQNKRYYCEEESSNNPTMTSVTCECQYLYDRSHNGHYMIRTVTMSDGTYSKSEIGSYGKQLGSCQVLETKLPECKN